MNRFKRLITGSLAPVALALSLSACSVFNPTAVNDGAAASSHSTPQPSDRADREPPVFLSLFSQLRDTIAFYTPKALSGTASTRDAQPASALAAFDRSTFETTHQALKMQDQYLRSKASKLSCDEQLHLISALTEVEMKQLIPQIETALAVQTSYVFQVADLQSRFECLSSFEPPALRVQVSSHQQQEPFNLVYLVEFSQWVLTTDLSL